jgi:hypothetical protein
MLIVCIGKMFLSVLRLQLSWLGGFFKYLKQFIMKGLKNGMASLKKRTRHNKTRKVRYYIFCIYLFLEKNKYCVII